MRAATRSSVIVFGLALLLSGELMGEVARPGVQEGIPPEVVAAYVYAIVQRIAPCTRPTWWNACRN